MYRVSALMMISAAFIFDLTLASIAKATGFTSRPAEADQNERIVINQATVTAEAPLRLPSTRTRPSQPSNERSGSSEQRSPQPSSSDRTEFNYRLIVLGSSDSLLQQVRRIVPDAFRTTIDRRRVIQAGLFVEREEAEAIRRQINRIDAETSILELDTPIVQRSVNSPSSDGSPSRRTGFNYRLVVQGSSDSLLRQVRRIVPDAFRTIIDGRRVVQAGLFVEREEAETIQRQLSRIDAETNIFDASYGIATRQTLPQSQVRVRDGRVVVVVDPGHGGGDPGAVGIGGLQEADVVLDISQQVAKLLEAQGVQAILTRTDDREIDLEPRVNLADSISADVFVSIHANSISLSRPDVNGIETYYYDTGSALASSIHNSLVNATGMNDRGVRQARFYVLTHTSMPAVLVEVGFVTGREDAAKLNNSSFRSQIATGIAQGILRYVQ